MQEMKLLGKMEEVSVFFVRKNKNLELLVAI
mgnify:CR=1 FL=1